jgi:RNA polymerase sigma-70 factor (ECF subfamily)
MTYRAAEDIDLIKRFLDGDAGAFDELMSAHEDRVFGICLRMLRDRDAALDAVQDTFVNVFRKADRYKAEAAFSTWLYRVAMNTCYDHLRKAKRRPTQPMPEHLDPADARSADGFDSADVRPEIEEALQALSPEFRAAVVLVDLEGLALENAANMLAVPVGTVKSRVFRGRKLLARQLGNLRPGSEHQIGE